MERLNLKVKAREAIGKEAVKKLRHKGLIPAVVYKKKNSQNLMLSTKDFLGIINTKAGENVIVDLQVEDDAKDKENAPAKSKQSLRTAIIKEIQYHPVSGDILHVDFNEISLTEVLTVKVPVMAKGQPQGLKEGGVLEHILREIEVECLPTQIPENIPVDVSALKIGDSILVKHLQVPPGLKVLSNPEASVIAVAAPQIEKEAELAPEGEIIEPEVIMERKPKEDEAASGEEPKDKAKSKEPDKEKK